MNKSLCILCFLLLYVGHALLCQQNLGKYERRWAIAHPFAALKVKKKLPLALHIYNTVKEEGSLDAFEAGGRLDAFRHVFTMACLAQSVKIKKLRKLGLAHEKDNYLGWKKNKLEFGERADSLACEMDLRNNDFGFFIGDARPAKDPEELKSAVIAFIRQGDAWFLKRNANGRYADCNGRDIDPALYKDRWFVPHCLIKTGGQP